MSEHLAAEQARARDAHDQLAQATSAHAAELERVRADALARVRASEAARDQAVAEAGKYEQAAAQAAHRAASAEARAAQSGPSASWTNYTRALAGATTIGALFPQRGAAARAATTPSCRPVRQDGRF